MNNAQDIFNGATDMQVRTDIFVNWMRSQNDGVKQRFRLNWRMPHSLFNIACKFFEGKNIQNIDWFQIYNREMPRWDKQLISK